MCSEMLQVAMAATAQRIGNADGSGSGSGQPTGPPIGNPELPTPAPKEGKGGGLPAEGADGKRTGGPPAPAPAPAPTRVFKFSSFQASTFSNFQSFKFSSFRVFEV